jgi:phosphoribosyl 1,2-cyclic phosphate phosphodiesterase
MGIELTFLGTGTSQGIPMIGCDCAVCHSNDPRDKRLRTSCLLSLDGHNVLIDATPELRLQCLRNDVRRLDAVLITHTHADHILGLDDVRRFNQLQKEPINIYVSALHRKSLEKVFGYARLERAGGNPDLPQFIFNTIEGAFTLFGYEIIPLLLPHGKAQVLGYRIGPVAYCTDFNAMPEAIQEQLQGLEVLVLGALRPRPHPAHLSIDQAVDLAQRLGARQTWLVHMAHQVSHHQLQKMLPEQIQLAYDGLRISVSQG